MHQTLMNLLKKKRSIIGKPPLNIILSVHYRVVVSHKFSIQYCIPIEIVHPTREKFDTSTVKYLQYDTIYYHRYYFIYFDFFLDNSLYTKLYFLNPRGLCKVILG